MVRRSTLIMILLAAALSIALFTVKYRVQDLESELGALNRQITEERRAIDVLKAEWAHLNDPARLKKLAERYLDLQPVTPDSVATRTAIGDRLASPPPEPQTKEARP